MISPQRLRHFVAVAEELHFRRAAARLNMSQPPLTQSIQLLERELDVVLFKRTQRRVELTRIGELLLPAARAALTQTRRFEETARRAAQGAVGRLRVGFSRSAPFVPGFVRTVREFRADRPEVALDLVPTSASSALDELRNGEIDIAVVRPFLPLSLPPGLAHVTIQRDALMLVLHASHRFATRRRLALRKVAEEPFILYPRYRATVIFQQTMALWTQAGILPRVTQEAPDAPTIMGLVALGMGISILPSALKSIHVDDIAWLGIEGAGGADASSVVLIYPEETAQEPPQSRFIELAGGVAL